MNLRPSEKDLVRFVACHKLRLNAPHHSEQFWHDAEYHLIEGSIEVEPGCFECRIPDEYARSEWDTLFQWGPGYER